MKLNFSFIFLVKSFPCFFVEAMSDAVCAMTVLDVRL